MGYSWRLALRPCVPTSPCSLGRMAGSRIVRMPGRGVPAIWAAGTPDRPVRYSEVQEVYVGEGD